MSMALLAAFSLNAQVLTLDQKTTVSSGPAATIISPPQRAITPLKVAEEDKIIKQNNHLATRGSVLSETFSSGSLPSGWSNVDNNGNGVWQFNNPGGRTLNSTTGATGFAIFDSDLYGSGITENADLITPAIDCSTLTAVTLTFEHYYKAISGQTGQVSVSGDNGATWTLLNTWTSSTANAALAQYDISAVAAGQSQVKIKWHFQGTWGWWWAIDDINIFEPDAHDLAVSSIIVPAKVFSDSIVSPVVTILNKGYSTESAYDVSLSDGDTYNETVNVTTAISPASSYSVTFPDWTPTAGVHTLTATITLAGDLNAANDSKALTVTAVPAKHDLAVNAISAPTSTLSDSIVKPFVSIGNVGDYNESTYAVTLTDNAGYTHTVDVTDAVNVGATYNVAFPDWTPGDGTYTLTATVTLAEDTTVANNTKSLTVVATPAQHDLGVYTINIPQFVLSDSTISPKVSIANYGNYDESEYSILLSDGGTYSETVNVTDSALLVGSLYVATFPDWTPAEGSHTLKATVTLASDVNGSNNSKTLIVTASNAKHDLAIGAINVPQKVLSDSLVSPVVTIINTGNYSESAYSVLLSDGGGYSETVNVTDLIASGAGYYVTFPDWAPAEGSHTLTATVTLAGDMDVSNDTMSLAVTASAAKHDLAAFSINNVPSKVFSDSLVSLVVSIKNTGDYPESTYSVLLSDGGAYSETVDVTTPIAVGDIYNVAFPDWTPTEGSYTLTATVTLAGDEVASNDSDTLTVVASKAVHDLAVSALPNAVERGSTIAPVVTVKNTGNYLESAYSVSLSDGGSYNQTVDISSTIAIGATYKVTFPDWTPADGTHTLTATVTLAGDEVESNNTMSQECRVIDARIAYVSTFNSGSVNGTLNVPFDTFTEIGRSSSQIQSLAWKDSLLLAITYDGKFGKVNTSDGSFTLIGSTGISANYFVSLVCDPTTGKVYTTTLTGGYPNFSVGLYSINPTTGLGKLVATSPQTGTFSQYAFDKDGNLYSIEHRPGLDGLFYSVNKATAEMTLIGDLGGVVSSNFQPMAWDFYNDVMYFQASGAMQGSYAINLTTGAATLVGTTPYAGQILAMALPIWDANLLDLKVGGITVPNFSPGKYTYNVLLPSGTVTVPAVTATPVYAQATKVITNASAVPGISTVVVTAPEGPSKTYTINFTVAENSDATLSNLTVKGATVVGFDPSTFTYNVVLHSGSSSAPMVTATTTDAYATKVITNVAALPGATTVEVTAADGTTQLTYTINFSVAAMTDATLTDLSVDGATVAGFDPATYSYDVVLPYGTTVFPDVTTTTYDTRAVTSITNGAALPGATNVVVTANDGVTQLTYTVNFTIAPPSTDATLSDLTVDGATVEGFDAATLTYTVDLLHGTTVVPAVGATTSYAHASTVITNASALPGTTTVVVTAEDGITQLTYTVEFTVTSGINGVKDDVLSVYPNPAIDVVHVKTSAAIIQIAVVNVNGKVLTQSEAKGYEATVNTTALSNGIYFLRIVTSQGVTTKKIQIIR